MCSNAVATMTRSLRTLLTDLVDYAGLFPPAKLGMPEAVETFNRALMGEEEWMLGRFITPLSRLEEFERAAAALLPGTQATSGYRGPIGEPWRLSVLLESAAPDSIARDLERIHAFNDRHDRDDAGLAAIDVVEVKVTDPAQIDPAIDALTEDLYPFFEFPVAVCVDAPGDCRGFVTALAGSPAGAKIRTGGVTGNAFPTPREVAAFLGACAKADVPFKATAGLHHPVRGSHRLTYEPGSASCTMHGFLNVFLAAGLLRAGAIDERTAEQLLADEEPDHFRFSEDVLGWRDYLMDTTQLARARETFAHSFGSCSFDEPVADLESLGLL